MPDLIAANVGMKQAGWKVSFLILFTLFFPASGWAEQAQVRLNTDTPGDHSSTRRPFPQDKLIAALESSEDHQARIFQVRGEVRILKKASEEWVSAAEDMLLEVGDQVLTGKGSFIDIAYDSYFLNLARIDENTKAEFLNIEPTIVRLEDGTVFSALDGLKPGDRYEIATPTAVAGVRGTHFLVSYVAQTLNFTAATFPVNDNVSNDLYIVSNDGTQSREVPEGSEFNWQITSQPRLEEVNIREVDQNRLRHFEDAFMEMSRDPEFEQGREEAAELDAYTDSLLNESKEADHSSGPLSQNSGPLHEGLKLDGKDFDDFSDFDRYSGNEGPGGNYEPLVPSEMFNPHHEPFVQELTQGPSPSQEFVNQEIIHQEDDSREGSNSGHG